MIKNVAALLVLAGMWVAPPAGAVVINIDFQDSGEVMTGNAGAVIPFAGSYWNASGTGSASTDTFASRI